MSPSQSQRYPLLSKQETIPRGIHEPATMAPPPPLPPVDEPHDSNIPCNALLSATLRHLPFSSPRSPSRQPHLLSAADRLAGALVAAASELPFLKPLLSLSSNLQTFFQVRCRRGRIESSLSAHNFAAILPGDSVAGLVVANGITNFLNIYNTLLVVRLVLTWFPNSPPVIVSPLSTLCDPYLNIFRGIIPPLGGTLDLSPILAFLVLNFFTSTAAALPAELPIATAPQQGILSSHQMFNLTATQEKWIRRVSCKRSKKSEDVQ